MKKIVIIGKGPAGISAAIYAVRSGVSVTVVAKDFGALAGADTIGNYYGFAEGIAAAQLLENGVLQAKNLGVSFVDDEVIGVEYYDSFVVRTLCGEIEADAVVIACGSARNKPRIKGVAEYEGRGVSYCAICDAFFFKNKKVAVIGAGSYALSECDVLKPVVGSVVLLTNGESVQTDYESRVGKIAAIEGGAKAERVVFEDGSVEEFDGIFVAYGSAGAYEIAKKLGLDTEGNLIAVDESMHTGIDGIFACGDCVRGVKQIAKAVYEGMVAGLEAVKFTKNA